MEGNTGQDEDVIANNSDIYSYKSSQKIPKCYENHFIDDHKCISLAISIVGKKTEWIDYVINHVKAKNSLTDKDVKIVHT